MSRISNCPKCTQPVTIPEGLDPTSTVRCPTCEGEYPLSEAAAGATEAKQAGQPDSDAMAFLKSLEMGTEGGDVVDELPPELVLVETIAVEPPVVVSDKAKPKPTARAKATPKPKTPASDELAFLRSLEVGSAGEEDADEALPEPVEVETIAVEPPVVVSDKAKSKVKPKRPASDEMAFLRSLEAGSAGEEDADESLPEPVEVETVAVEPPVEFSEEPEPEEAASDEMAFLRFLEAGAAGEDKAEETLPEPVEVDEVAVEPPVVFADTPKAKSKKPASDEMAFLRSLEAGSAGEEDADEAPPEPVEVETITVEPPVEFSEEPAPDEMAFLRSLEVGGAGEEDADETPPEPVEVETVAVEPQVVISEEPEELAPDEMAFLRSLEVGSAGEDEVEEAPPEPVEVETITVEPPVEFSEEPEPEEPAPDEMAFLRSLEVGSASEDEAEEAPPEPVDVEPPVVVAEELEPEPEEPAPDEMAFPKSLEAGIAGGGEAEQSLPEPAEMEAVAVEPPAWVSEETRPEPSAAEPGKPDFEAMAFLRSLVMETEGGDNADEALPAAVSSPGDPAAEGQSADEPNAQPQGDGSAVERPEAAEAAGDSGEGGPEALVAQPPPVDLDPLVRSPHAEGAFRLSELILVSTGESLGPVTASLVVKHDLLRPRTEEEAGAAAGPALDAWGQAGAGPQWDFGVGPGAVFGDSSGLAIKDEDREREEAMPISARPRRRRKEKSVIREIIGVVLGGVAGLIMASYIVVLIKGDHANFLKVPLPGCPSTYRHCPPWWPQWLRIGEKSEEEEGEEAPEDESGAPETPAEPTSTGSGEQRAEKPVPGPGLKPELQPAAKPAQTGVPQQPTSPAAAQAPAGAAPASYTSEDLGEALAKANAAFGCKDCNSTGKVTETATEVREVDGQKKEVKVEKTVACPVCKGQPSRVMGENSFQEFCRLGEVIAFVGQGDQQQLGSRRMAVRGLLETAGASEAELGKIGEFADARLADESRLDNGICLGGVVAESGPRGGLHVLKILLAKSAKPVVVVSRESMSVAKDDRVLVLGSIVEEPKRHIAGFQGNETKVVLAGECVRLP